MTLADLRPGRAVAGEPTGHPAPDTPAAADPVSAPPPLAGTASTADVGRTARRPVRSWVRALRRGPGLVGLLLLAVLVLLGVAAPLLAPYDPNLQLRTANLLPPSAEHLFGTDEVNRDVFSRVLWGIRTSLTIVAVGVPIGAVIGALAALLGTSVSIADVALQRVFDLVLAFPTLIFAIGLTAVVGPGVGTVIAVIATVEAPIFARVLRTAVLKVQALPYVETAEVIGAGRWWILRRHVLPNAAEPLGVQVALSLSLAVFVESAMSFLGIGVRPPDPSLGSLISSGIDYAELNPGYVVAPLITIVVLVLALQLIARALGAARRVTA